MLVYQYVILFIFIYILLNSQDSRPNCDVDSSLNMAPLETVAADATDEEGNCYDSLQSVVGDRSIYSHPVFSDRTNSKERPQVYTNAASNVYEISFYDP